MWGEFCEVFAPNVERQKEQLKDAVTKYTTIALIRYTLKRILGKV